MSKKSWLIFLPIHFLASSCERNYKHGNHFFLQYKSFDLVFMKKKKLKKRTSNLGEKKYVLYKMCFFLLSERDLLQKRERKENLFFFSFIRSGLVNSLGHPNPTPTDFNVRPERQTTWRGFLGFYGVLVNWWS